MTRPFLRTASIRKNQTYGDTCAQRKINHLDVVTSSFPAISSNAGNFSGSSIEARIQAGYDDAIAQGVGRIDSSELGWGISSGAAKRATSAVPMGVNIH